MTTGKIESVLTQRVYIPARPAEGWSLDRLATHFRDVLKQSFEYVDEVAGVIVIRDEVYPGEGVSLDDLIAFYEQRGKTVRRVERERGFIVMERGTFASDGTITE